MPKPLKILFLSSSDSRGGAAKAAYRLFENIRKQGISVKMLVRDKSTNDPDIISCFDFERKGLFGKLDIFLWKIKNRMRKQKWKKYPDRETVFLNDLDSISLLRAIRSIDFDVLHLHFIANRFLDLTELTKINKPIVWTLHDSWSFTGICHFFYDCKHYEQSCGSCPMLHSDNPNDFTHKIWEIKKIIYSQCNMHIVAPSRWLGNCASNSSLFHNLPVTIIPNGINTQLYLPFQVSEARKKLHLNPEKRYLMFGAVNASNDKNKGFDLLFDSLFHLKLNIQQEIEIIVIGAEKPNNKLNFGLPVKYMGIIDDENIMVEIYNAVDVVIVPSRSENLSYTIMESMACGTPVVAFEIGGNSDMIDHKQNGYLAKPFDTDDLANGIIWCINNNKNNILSISATKKVEEKYNIDKIVESYKKIYKLL